MTAARKLKEVPEGFVLKGVCDLVARNQAIEILDRLKADHSGHDKALRELEPVQWALHLHGGGASADRKRLADQELAREQLIVRIDDFKERHLATGAGETQLASTEKEISRLKEVVAAAGGATLDDQVARRARRDRAARRVDEIQGQLAPYRAARIRTADVERLERKEHEVERRLADAEAAFQEGAATMRRLGEQRQKLQTRVLERLAASCRTACEVLGIKAAKELRSDLDFFTRYPHRCPVEVEGFYRQAAKLDALIDQLVREPGRGLHAFLAGAGNCGTVVAARFGLAPLPPRRGPVETVKTLMEAVL